MNKVLKKWSPVIESLLNDVERSDEIKQFIAEYAEHHAEQINESDSEGLNLLPVSMMVLKKLSSEFNDVKFNINNENYETHIVSLKESIDTMRQIPDNIQRVESILVNELEVKIKKELENKKNLDINLLVSKLVMEEDHGYVNFTLSSLYKIY